MSADFRAHFVRCWSGALGAALLVAADAAALGLRLDPAETELMPGAGFRVTLVLSQLDGDSVGAFDIRFAWDAAILSAESALLLPALGDSLGAVQIQAGGIRLWSVSLLPSAALAAGQDDEIAIAVLSMRALAPGTTHVGAVSLVVGDPEGAAIPVDAFASPTLHVAPEPASLALLAMGLAILARSRPP